MQPTKPLCAGRQRHFISVAESQQILEAAGILLAAADKGLPWVSWHPSSVLILAECSLDPWSQQSSEHPVAVHSCSSLLLHHPGCILPGSEKPWQGLPHGCRSSEALRTQSFHRGWKEWEANSLTLLSQGTGRLTYTGAGYLVVRAFPARCSTSDQGSAHHQAEL